MKEKANIRLITSCSDGLFRFEIEDDKSSERIIEIRFNDKQFFNFIKGLSVDVDVNYKNLELIGKARVIKNVSAYCENPYELSQEQMKKLALNHITENHPEWQLWDNLSSQNTRGKNCVNFKIKRYL